MVTEVSGPFTTPTTLRTDRLHAIRKKKLGRGSLRDSSRHRTGGHCESRVLDRYVLPHFFELHGEAAFCARDRPAERNLHATLDAIVVVINLGWELPNRCFDDLLHTQQ